MGLPLTKPTYFHYEYLDSTRGTRIHLISYDRETSDVVSVSVSAAFGSKHLSYLDEAGALESFPVGMAHFMEHFLFWLCYDDVLVPLSLKYACDPNAVVTYDKTVWGLKGGWVTKIISFQERADDAQKIAGVLDITGRLLAVLRSEPPAVRFESLMAQTKNDIDNEIGYRHNDISYPMKLELLRSLYRESPVRNDILGTSESLSGITQQHVLLALRLIRTNIQSVIVRYSRLSNNGVDKLKQSLLDLISRQPVEPQIRPVPPSIETLEINKISSGVPRPMVQYSSQALLGLKLPPLQQSFSDPEKLKRAYLLSHLAINSIERPVSGIISPHFRTYVIAGTILDPWFFWEKSEIRKAMTDLKRALIHKLEQYREYFEMITQGAFAKTVDNPNRLMKLCHAADLYDYDLNELFDVFAELRPEDLDELISELRDTRGNASLVYTYSSD